jgi:hypothetical protein
VQVIDFKHLGRDECVQSVDFLVIRQLFGERDLADLLFNGHGSIAMPLGVPAQVARLLPPVIGMLWRFWTR